jgi:hypothetical protein
MLWLKRNLGWTVVIAVAVILTAFGGYYIWSNKARNDELNQKLGAAKAELNRLTTEVKPSPSPENVRAAREDVRKSQEFAAMVRRLFVPTPAPVLNNQTYRSMLETNLAALRRLAALSGVEIPTNYSFSFEPQTKQMTFEPASLKPLSEQLTEISEVCRGLFAARIHSLDVIRRVAVSQYDSQGSTEILQGVALATNRFTGLWAWPYQFSFDCFSGELAAALEEINRIPRMAVVKTIQVEARDVGAAPPPPSSPGAPQPEVQPQPGQFRRGPRGARLPPNSSVKPPPGAPAAKPPPTALTTVLEESLLHVIIEVDVIKPVR